MMRIQKLATAILSLVLMSGTAAWAEETTLTFGRFGIITVYRQTPPSGWRTAFEFHVANWIGGSGAEPFVVRPEIEKIAGPTLLCLYGAEGPERVCPLLDKRRATVKELKGGHHFGGDTDSLIEAIMAQTQP